MYRLLIAAADDEECKSIQQLLRWTDYGIDRICTANNYVEAISVAVDLRPHIAIIDTALEPYQGYVLASHLHSMGIDIHFAIMADTMDPYHMRKSMQAGALDYLLKPVSRKDLADFLVRVIESRLHGTLPEAVSAKPELDPILQREYAQLSSITNKVILCVKSNFPNTPSLADIAEQLHMNSKYIGRIFLRDTGIKYTDYLMAYRMQEARRLIINTQEKISVIAGMVGYSQQNNFHIHFKQFFHTSPSKLRQFNDITAKEQ